MVQVNRAVSASHISSFWRPVLTPKKRPAAVLRRMRARAAVRLVPIVTIRHVTSRSSRVTLGSVWCPHTGEVSIQLITHCHNPGPPASGDPEWGEGDK